MNVVSQTIIIEVLFKFTTHTQQTAKLHTAKTTNQSGRKQQKSKAHVEV